MADSDLEHCFVSKKALSELGHSFLRKQHGCEQIVHTWPVLLTEAEIDLSCRFVAAELNAKFRGQHIVLCGILKGVYVFLSDLTKHLTIPYSVYFVEASSYGDKQQAGELQFMSQLVPSKFHNRKVILLDELFDHGTTIHAIATALVKNADLRLKADDVFTCTLFSKHSGTKLAPPDLVGMNELPGVWLVGYGLDDAGEKRGWVHLFGCPKAPGVPREPADDAIGSEDAKAKAALRALRAPIVRRLAEMSEKLKQHNPVDVL